MRSVTKSKDDRQRSHRTSWDLHTDLKPLRHTAAKPLRHTAANAYSGMTHKAAARTAATEVEGTGECIHAVEAFAHHHCLTPSLRRALLELTVPLCGRRAQKQLQNQN
ncbi:uncharacterized protein V6R79_025073 [Siganus canaliculatus]